MYPLDSHTAGRTTFRTRRAHGEHDESAWLSLRTKEVRRDRHSTFRRFVHVLGLCFR
jgi:hypothetical protein